MEIFRGSGVAIVTPMNADGSINLPKLDELLEEQIAGSTDAIIICGTTGESATMTVAEHLEVIRHCVETVNGRIPVIAGTGSNDTETAIELSVESQKYGADALLLVTPYYNKGSQKGLIRHFETIAGKVDIPIILYNVPSRTGVNIQPETLAHLAKNVDNIVAVKAASGNLSQIAKAIHLCGEDFTFYSGDDDQTIPICSLGGKGVISVLANVAPKYTHDMVFNFLEGNVKEAAKMQLDAIPLINALFCEVNPIPVKEAMNMMGREVGPFRLPLCEMEDANRDRLRQAMIDFGIDVTC